MKIRILILLLAFLFISCKDKKPDLISIEYIAFNWTSWDAETQQFVPRFFKCRIYADIDKTGKARVYIYGNIPELNSNYLEIPISFRLIQRVDSLMSKVSKHEMDSIYFRWINPPGRPIGYEGPEVKIRLNYNNGDSIMFSFMEDENRFRRIGPLLELHKQFYGIKSKVISKFSDTTEFNERRLNFIKSTIIADTCFSKEYKLPIRILFNNKIVSIEELFGKY